MIVAATGKSTTPMTVQSSKKDIDTLGKWAESWGMRFQPVKCNMMTLSHKKKTIEYKYTLKGTELEFLTSIKYLGVNITNDLHWGKLIEEICNKSYRTLGLLKRNLSSCPMEVKLQAYKGLIRPVLEYASTAWDPHQSYLQEKLEKVKKRAARFIISNYNYEPGSMTTILKQTKLEPLKERRKQNRLILFCKGVHHLVEIPTDNLQRPLRTTKNMLSQHYLRLPAKTDILKFSFLPNTVKDWNLLSPDFINKIQSAEEPAKSFADIAKGNQ